MTNKTANIDRRGFTLVEMMVGLTLLGIIMTGVLSSLRVSLIVSESTIYQNTASTAAQSYLEQIKNLPYEDILQAIQDPSNVELNTISPSYDFTGLVSIVETPLSIDPSNQPNQRSVKIDLNENGTITTVEMPMKFWLTAVDLNTGSSPINGLEIKLKYAYELPAILGGEWHEKQVQTIRSRI